MMMTEASVDELGPVDYLVAELGELLAGMTPSTSRRR
jgi:hypothetical protein